MDIGIDIGASFCKAVLVNSEKHVVKSVRIPMPNKLNLDAPEKIEYNLVDIVNIVFKLILDITSNYSSEIKTISVTGQMHGMVLLDENYKPITNFISWQDKRCNKSIGLSSNTILNEVQLFLNPYRVLTGTDVRSGMLAPLLLWFKRNNLLPKFYRISFLPDYIVSILSGKTPFCDPTNAAASGIYNIIDQKWLREFVEFYDLDLKSFPSVLSSGSLIGSITRELSFTLKLPLTTKIFVATGDFQATLFANNLNENDLSFNIGTGAQVSVLEKEFKKSLSYEVRPFYDSYVKCVSGLPGGLAFSYFQRLLSSIEKIITGRSERDLLNLLDNLASQKDELCNHNMMKLNNRGEVLEITNFDQLSNNIVNFYIAYVNAIVNSYLDAIKRLGLDMSKYTNIVLSGGVAIKNTTLKRLISCNINKDIIVVDELEQTALGAVLIMRFYHEF